MIRQSSSCSGRRLGSLALAASTGLLAVACARTPRPPAFATTDELAPAPRHPDGVAVDPATELPSAVEAARADAVIATLRAPAGDRAALEVVRAFFRAVVAEDGDALAALLTADATPGPRPARGASPNLADQWRLRMRRLEYRPLAGETVFRDADVETYRYEDLEAAIPGRPSRPPDMDRSELLLRVPVAKPRSGNDRLFGDELVLVLRREGGRYRIREQLEDFTLP